MDGVKILQDVLEILIGGLTTTAEGIGSGLSTLAQSIFLATGEGGTTTLSVFGILVVVFAGISLALGLFRWVVNFVTSLGARNR